MKKVPTRSLATGDRVLFRGDIYIAVELGHEECWTECCLFNHETQMCDGLCFRYEDIPPVAFKYLKPVTRATNDTVKVSVTDFTD